MKKLTPEQRSAVAKIAAAAREAKRRRLRYALALPAPEVIRRRLQVLEAEAPGEIYLFCKVAMEGKNPASLANGWGITEAEVLRRVQEAIRKLTR